MLEILLELVRSAIKESECVALFVIALFVLVILHRTNVGRLRVLKNELREHVRGCNNGED